MINNKEASDIIKTVESECSAITAYRVVTLIKNQRAEIKQHAKQLISLQKVIKEYEQF